MMLSAGVADDGVVGAVAGAVDRGAVEDQQLDIGADRIVDRGVDDVVALAGILDDGVAGIVDEIDVVAGAARP